jgi:putative NADPH-quinone reductase
MPKVVVVAAHPDSASFTLALAREAGRAAAALGASVTVHDLHADGFDPRMAAAEVGTTQFADELTARYAQEVLTADALVLVHPVWFFHVPAMLKGWVDRVLRDGVVYELGSGGKSAGLWRVKAALVINTANSPEQVEGALGEPLERFWRDVVLGPAGVQVVTRVRCAKVLGSSDEQRAAWLVEARVAAEDLVRSCS